MATKRMMSMHIVDTDAFLEMPVSSQLLYFHLVMRADDEGFVGSPKKILRMVGAQEDDLKILIAKRFVIAFETGVLVIKHWMIHNVIRMDRLNPTKYQDERKSLEIKENGAYTELCQADVRQLPDKSPHKLSKVKLSKVNLIKNKYAEDVELTETEYESLKERLGCDRERAIEILSNYKGSTGKKYKSDYKAILGWVTDKITKEGGKSNQPKELKEL